MPRFIGILFDLLHQFTWRHYVRYLEKSGVGVLTCGDCKFYFEECYRGVLEDSLRALKARDPESFQLLKNTKHLEFLLEGNFPDYSKVSNLKLRIRKDDAAKHTVEGIIPIIGYSLVLEADRERRGAFLFRLLPRHDKEVRDRWISWMKNYGVEDWLIAFYKSTPFK